MTLTLSSLPRSLTKTQMVEAILEVNGTADREWLMAFEFAALQGYWRRLQHALAPRGSAWDTQREGACA